MALLCIGPQAMTLIYRAARAVEIYTTASAQVLRKTVEEETNYIYPFLRKVMKFEEKECREDVNADTYLLVYQSDDGRIRIYGTKGIRKNQYTNNN